MEKITHSPPRTQPRPSTTAYRTSNHSRTSQIRPRQLETSSTLTNLLKSTTDFLCSRQTRIEDPGLIEDETWQVVTHEEQNKTAFVSKIQSLKHSVSAELDSLIRNFSEAVESCKSVLLTKLDSVSSNYLTEYDCFLHDAQVYCDKARRILEEEKSNLISEVTTSIRDPWTQAQLGENVQIVARHCLETDVERAYANIKSAREESEIEKSAERLLRGLENVSEALVLQKFEQVVGGVGGIAISRLNKEIETTSSVLDPKEVFEIGVVENLGDNLKREAKKEKKEISVRKFEEKTAEVQNLRTETLKRGNFVESTGIGQQRSYKYKQERPEAGDYVRKSVNHNVREVLSPGAKRVFYKGQDSNNTIYK